MNNLGCFKSNLKGAPIAGTPKGINLPGRYSILQQMEPPCDQGSRGICVSVCTYDMCKYLYKGLKKQWNTPMDFFYNNRKNKTIDGMTPREALEIAQANGYIKSYALLKNPLAIRYSLLSNGPVLICLPVYDNSGNIERFWDKSYGSLIGYHAVTLVQYTTTGFLIRNSWGTGFGKEGYAQFQDSDVKCILEAWTIYS